MNSAGARQLVAFTRTVSSSPRLAKALVRSDLPRDAKRALVADLLTTEHRGVVRDGHTSDTVVRVVDVAQSGRHSSDGFVSALASAAAQATYGAAQSEGVLEEIESRLMSFAQLVRDNPELRAAFRSISSSSEAKHTLLADLLRDKARPEVLDLLSLAVATEPRRNIDEAAIWFAEQAAQHRGRVVAYITTAIEIDDARRRALTAVVEQNAGRPVQARFSVDESIVGSVVVRIGDEVLDGSITHRLAQARNALDGVIARSLPLRRQGAGIQENVS